MLVSINGIEAKCFTDEAGQREVGQPEFPGEGGAGSQRGADRGSGCLGWSCGIKGGL